MASLGLEQGHQCYIILWKWFIYDWKVALKAQVGYMKSGPNAHGPLSCYSSLPSPACTYASWGAPHGQLEQEERLGLAYRWSAWHAGTTLEVVSCSATAPLWDVLKDRG